MIQSKSNQKPSPAKATPKQQVKKVSQITAKKK
jgi:hypothetical protein